MVELVAIAKVAVSESFVSFTRCLFDVVVSNTTEVDTNCHVLLETSKVKQRNDNRVASLHNSVSTVHLTRSVGKTTKQYFGLFILSKA